VSPPDGPASASPRSASTAGTATSRSPFLRLRWTGSPDEWAIGIYKATTETYSENEFPWSYGPLTGTPEQGIDETLALYAGPPAGQ
jgi:hypothetical protein